MEAVCVVGAMTTERRFHLAAGSRYRMGLSRMMPPDLTGHARFREPGRYAFIAGNRPGGGPGADRVSADIEYRPLVSHLLAFRVAGGREIGRASCRRDG